MRGTKPASSTKSASSTPLRFERDGNRIRVYHGARQVAHALVDGGMVARLVSVGPMVGERRDLEERLLRLGCARL